MHQFLGTEFARFADECRNSSPLYERLSLAVASDSELLTLAAHARPGQMVPNLFFAAVRFLLLKGIQHPLSVFYNSVSGPQGWSEDPYPKFRSFCLEHEEEIRRLISVRLVQTNEVGRCACLLPIFGLVSRQSQGRPLYILEIGTAAGLILLWDRYGYKYGESLYCGDRDSPVQITCALRGDLLPPLPEILPEVAVRIGVDLNPIDVHDSVETLWLRALVWPEHARRARLLDNAIQVAQQNPPKLMAGDGTELLPGLLAAIPEGTVPCIVRTWTTLAPKAREQLLSVIALYGAKRDVFVISTKGHHGDRTGLELISFQNGVKTDRLLANCESHGEWLEWLWA